MCFCLFLTFFIDFVVALSIVVTIFAIAILCFVLIQFSRLEDEDWIQNDLGDWKRLISIETFTAIFALIKLTYGTAA